MSDVNIRSVKDLNQLSDTKSQEIARILFNLRQRFDDSSNYKALVSAIKYFETSSVEQNRHVKIDSSMENHIKEAASLANLTDVMDYQINTWNLVHKIAKKNEIASVIISAETGMGKTEAAIPIVIREALESNSLAILIFPRRALLKDQLQRIAKYNYNLANNSTHNSNPPQLRIAVQMGGIAEKIYWTVYNDREKDEINNKDYTIESEFITARYLSDEFDTLSLLDIKCPVCGKSLEHTFRFKKSARGFGRDARNIQANSFVGEGGKNYVWSCPEHNDIEYNISFSREDHVKLNPNVLFTTIDSLESLLLDPEFGSFVKDKAKFVVLDEIHTYSGIYGAHASSIIQKLNERLHQKPILLGLSATVSDPVEFAQRLFHTDSTHTYSKEPLSSDRSTGQNAAKRRFFFLKAAFDEKRYYPLLSQVMIQSSLLFASSIANVNNQMLAFIDTINGVTRMKAQTIDAYDNLRLHNIRLDNLINQNATFDAHPCKGFSPYGCANGCYVYEHGECWALTRHRNGLNSSPSTIDIAGVTAGAPESRNSLISHPVIFSTSELELGIDLPNVSNLFQYSSPYSVTSLIQRVGRAGRRPGVEPLIFLILGESASDYIYYRNGSRILTGSLSTPLNDQNKVINKLHADLFDIADMAIEKINKDNRPIKKYVKEIIDTWEVVESEFGANFQSEFNNLRIQELLTKTGWDDVKVYRKSIDVKLEEKIQETKKKLNETFTADGSDPRKQVSDAANEIALESSKLGVDASGLSKKVNEFLEDFNLPPELQTTETKLKELNQATLNLLESVARELARQSVPNSNEMLQRFAKLSELFNDLASKSELSTSQIRSEFYLMQFYTELKDAFGKSSLLDIIKSSFRARYFLEVSKDFYGLEKVYPFPKDFFQLGRYYCIKVERRSKDSDKISIDDTLSKFSPFNLNSNPMTGFSQIVLPEVTEVPSKGLVFSTSSFMDFFVTQGPLGNKFAFPRLVEYYNYKTEPVNGLLKYCDHCHKFYSFAWKGVCKNCKHSLQDTKIYSNPNIDSRITSDAWDQNSAQTFISKVATLTRTLTGVSITLTPAIRKKDRYLVVSKRARELDIEAEVPYGYSIKTWALRIHVRPDIISRMINAYRIEFPTIASRLPDSDLTVMALHTISHLWTILCAEYSQISSESFSYDWETNGEEHYVKLSEDQEGGAGFIENVADVIVRYPSRIYDSLVSITECDEHNGMSSQTTQEIYDWIKKDIPADLSLSHRQQIISSYAHVKNLDVDDVMQEYPTCIDGCNNCVVLSNCRQSGQKQLDDVSLVMAKAYVNAIAVIESDKDRMADFIKWGWRTIREIDGGKGGHLIIDL